MYTVFMSIISNIKISKALPEDIQKIGDVFYKTWLDTYPNEELGITFEDIEDRYKNRNTEDVIERGKKAILEQQGNELFLVAKDGELVVGVCRAFVYPDKNELQVIYILPDYQRRGLGRLFWEEVKKFFDVKRVIIVNVATYNTKAIEFYKKIGFIDTGKRFSNEKFRFKSGSVIPEMEMEILAIC